MNRSRKTRGLSRHALPAAAAIGSLCGLAAAPAAALELGALRMESVLGQPLRASVAYTLNANESLYDFCISLKTPQSGDPIPSVTRARISVTGDTIVLTGSVALRDPLLKLRIAVDCPYTPHLARDYTLIVDPVLPQTRPSMLAGAPAAQGPVTTPAAVAGSAAGPVPVAGPRRDSGDGAPIAAESLYRARNGDTASTIAARIEGRTIGLWPAVRALVAANPDAFIGADADRLVSGAELSIPSMSGSAAADADAAVRTTKTGPATAAGSAETVTPDNAGRPAETAADVADATPVADTADAISQATAGGTQAAGIGAMPESADTAPDPLDGEADIESAPSSDSAPPATEAAAAVAAREALPDPMPAVDGELKPGDVVVATPPANRAAAVPPVQTDTAPVDGSSGSWFTWLAAGAAALILGGFAFRRRLTALFGSVAVNAPADAAASPDEEETVTSTVIDDVDFDFDDPAPAASVALDADLDVGTGLNDSGELDVAQDFGFDSESAANGQVDVEIPEEANREPDRPETDIIAPSHRIEASSILESEIQPSDEDYDLSMIVDATRQNIGEDDLTAQDLGAIPVGSGEKMEEYAVEDSTLATETDMEILEQDYEEEFTQTQAVNQEIERAAAELARSMAAADASANVTEVDFELEPTAVAATAAPGEDFELTAEMPATAAEDDLDPTAQMPDAPIDPGMDPTVEMTVEDDSGTHPELTANIPVDAEALNDDLVDPDVTSKLAAAGSDVTVEMEVESGSVDTTKDDA